MQFVVKHPSQFMNSNMSFMVGFWQMSGGLLSEILCIIHLTQNLNVVFTIISGATFGCIANVDNFYAASLPPENAMSGKYV
jgi:hypothetical protein